MTFTIAIVGRPNVGKSTLFNRLVGRRAALVDDTPGVTRDRREGDGRLGPLRFRLFDTAGLEEGDDESLAGRMMLQTKRAVEEADLALLLIDGRAGLTPTDEHFGRMLRQSETPVAVIVTKCEGEAGAGGIAEAWGLGLGEPVPISAEHAEGLSDLYDALASNMPHAREMEEAAGRDEGKDEDQPLRLAIVGRPNVGKSTLLNRLVGDERVITGPEAGLTRDAISVAWKFGDREVELVDTAGLRRRSRVVEDLEKLSVADARRSLGRSEVVVLVFDASLEPMKQDFTIASLVVDEGRALVIALNKWDALPNPQETLEAYHGAIGITLSQAKGVPVVPLSALTGRGVERLMPVVLEAYDRWNIRVPTSALNRWLGVMVEQHPPPLAAGRRIRLRYVTQAKARPPTFAAFCNRPADLPDSYRRYLVNGLREAFDLPGVPIRFNLRKTKNPYAS